MLCGLVLLLASLSYLSAVDPPPRPCDVTSRTRQDPNPNHALPILNGISFSVQIEANIREKGYSQLVGLYYDKDDGQIAAHVLQGGETTLYIYTYTTGELVIVKDTSCQVKNLTTDTGIEQMYLSAPIAPNIDSMPAISDILRFGDSYGEVYKGNAKVRGMTTERWYSCQTWAAINATVAVNYYFNAANWTTTMTDEDVPKLPVMATVTGNAFINGAWTKFDHQYNFFDFRPNTSGGRNKYQIPAITACVGRLDGPDAPLLPKFNGDYSYSKEIVTVGQFAPSNVWFSSQGQFFREDHVDNSGNPYTEIHDYNTGVAYLRDNRLGNCTLSNILANSTATRLNIKRGQTTNGSVLHMKNPLVFLDLDLDYKFVGVEFESTLPPNLFRQPAEFSQGNERGIPVNIWSGIKYDYIPPAERMQPENITNTTTIFTYYFSTQRTAISLDGSREKQVPVKLEVFVSSATGPDTYDVIGSPTIYNFYNFNQVSRIPFSVFQVTDCYGSIARTRLKIQFIGVYQPSKKYEMLQNFQTNVAAAMGVSPLRIQQINLDYDHMYTYAYFTLVNAVPYADMYDLTGIGPGYHQIVFSGKLSVEACAQACAKNGAGAIRCDGFSLCNGMCAIKAEVTSVPTPSTTGPQCDMYQKTVNGVSPAKMLDVAEAYRNLHTNVIADPPYGLAFGAGDTTYSAVHESIINGYISFVKMNKNFPKQFYYRQEIVDMIRREVSLADVWYDSVNTISRYDVTYSKSTPPLNTKDPTTFIQDFNRQTTFAINKKTNQCRLMPLQALEFDVLATNATGAIMKTPQEIFRIDDNYMWVGQRMWRGVLCDVFESVEPRTDYNPTPFLVPDAHPKSIWQYYYLSSSVKQVSTDPWDKTAMSSNIPYGAVISVPSKKYYLTFNFFGFNDAESPLTVFDTSACFNIEQKVRFRVKLKGSYNDVVNNAVWFTKEMRLALGQLVSLSPFRINEDSVLGDSQYVYYSATLLDRLERKPYVEQSLSAAWVGMRDMVYGDGINLDLTLPNGQKSKFSAVSIVDVLFGSGEVKAMQSFSVIGVEISLLRTQRRFVAVSVDDCANNCVEENGFVCMSFSYSYDTSTCDLSSTSPDNNIQMSAVSEVFKRNDVDFFEQVAGQTIMLQAKTTTGQVTSPTACARLCLAKSDYSCRSFQYCNALQSCGMSDNRALVMPQQNMQSAADCKVYSRNYYFEFKMAAGKVITLQDNIILYNLSPAECAKACVQLEGDNCLFFDHCPNSTLCRVTSDSMKNTGQGTVQSSAFCNRYTRNGDVKAPSGDSSSNKSYNGGDMAGLAIGMIMLGALAGIAAFFVFTNRKTIRDDGLSVHFVKNKE